VLARVIRAASEGDLDTLTRASDAELALADSNSWTALHHAARKGHANVIRLLASRHAE
jgi:ankyrin repeat protein